MRKRRDLVFCVRAHEKEEITTAGYKVKVRYYRNQSCQGCPHMGKCHPSTREYREIKVSPKFICDRAKSLENITSEEGYLLRTNRSIQVEGVFGVLKQDFRFRRFLTRGKGKVETQFSCFLLLLIFKSSATALKMGVSGKIFSP